MTAPNACRASVALAALIGVAAQAQTAMVEHRVQPGDTLIALLREGADWRPVQRANRIADPRRLVPGSVLRIPVDLLRERPTVAEVVHAYGEVTVSRGGAAPAPLQGGESVAAGDVVRTGAQSSATLRFADGARVLVRPDSELKLERLMQSRSSASTTLRLERGSADSQVPPAEPKAAPRRYEMRTPHVNLGVRGTEFRASTAEGASRVEVLDGRVGAGRGRGEAALAAGFGARADGTSLGPPLALPEAPRLAGLPDRIERMPLRLAWQSDAPRVRAQVFAAGEPPRLVLDGVFEGSVARWSEDIADGRYELRVRAIGAEGLEGRDTRAAFTLKARPEPPFASAPATAARTVDEAPRFAWTRNPAAARVRLQVADTPDFASPRIDRSDLTDSELRVALPLGTHHWRLASIRDDGTPGGDQGPFGDAQRVTRIAPPPAPPSSPPQATDEGVLLRWQGSEAPPGTRWQVQVARDRAFTAPLARDETVAEPQLLLRQPEPGTYHVRVKTIDADGFAGPFGQPQQVDVPHSKWWWLLVPALLLLL